MKADKLLNNCKTEYSQAIASWVHKNDLANPSQVIIIPRQKKCSSQEEHFQT